MLLGHTFGVERLPQRMRYGREYPMFANNKGNFWLRGWSTAEASDCGVNDVV
jgi:hypothetical protein